MPYTIDTDTHKRLIKLDRYDWLRVFVEVPVGTVRDQLKGFSTAPQFGRTHELLSSFLIYTLQTAITHTKAHDKVELLTMWHTTKENRETKAILLKGCTRNHQERVRRNQFCQRMTVIGGLALSSVLEGATFKAYDRTQTVSNRLFNVKGAAVRTDLQKHLTFTGNTQVDFNAAFHYLWFAFPYAVTEEDDWFKKVSLMYL